MPDVTVSRTIDAPPEAVWKLVSDPTRMGDWSPGNTGAAWLDGASGPAVGTRFRGSNKNGRISWKTTCTVTECVENEAFAFHVKTGPIALATWAYRLGAADGGTVLTEEFTKHEPKAMEAIMNRVLKIDSRNEFNRVGMEATLAAIAAELESPS